MDAFHRNALWIGACLLIAGVILFSVGLMERRLASRASQEPEAITLQALVARGPAGNPNVILRDFGLCENFVYEEKYGSWSKAWVPVVPRGAPTDGRGPIQALVFTLNARNEADLNARCGQPDLRVLVTNEIVSLGSGEKQLLEKSYPGTDFSRCLILQEGREPAGAAKQLLMIGGGALALLLGLGLVGFAAVSWYQARQAPPPKKRRKRVQEEDEDEEEEERPRKRRPRRREDDDD